MARIVTSVDVDRPVRAVYDQWTRFERFPVVFRSVLDTQQLDDSHVQWRVSIWREPRTWVARITEQVPDQRIAWTAVDGVAQAGVVTFHRLDADRTRVMLQLDWEPRGTFEVVGDRFGIVRRRIDDELARFKETLEERRYPSDDGWRGEIRQSSDGHDGAPSEDPFALDRRGRTATSPTDIPGPGWKDVVLRAKDEAKDDNVPILAAGVAFFLMLALVPALVAVVTIFALVTEPSEVVRSIGDLIRPLPTDVEDLIREQLETLAGASEAGLGIGAVVSVLGAVWSASKGMKALVAAVNLAFDEKESRKFLKLRGIALVLTVGTVLTLSASVAAITVLPALGDRLGAAGRLTASILRWPLLALLMTVGLAVLYRYAPDRDPARWRWVTPGSVVATLLWLAGSGLFAVYVDHFGKFNDTYGSLGAVVVLMLWLDLTAYIVLLGAEINAETERQTVHDTTRGHREPMGRRDAHAADTLGPAQV